MLNLSGTWNTRGIRSLNAFTLVELLIVLGIVVLLMGLTVAATTAMVQESEVRETEQRLKLLDLALQEWETATDRSLTMGTNGQGGDGTPDSRARYDLQQETKFNFVISEVLQRVRGVPAAKSILAEFPPDALYTYEKDIHPPWVRTTLDQNQQNDRFIGKLTVLDAWDWPIYATHPGRAWNADDGDNPPRDHDGTIRTENERTFGVARNGKVCFVSAGPDNDFGNYRQANFPGYNESTIHDNVYSYSPIVPPAAPW